jgi:hypothetical protein
MTLLQEIQAAATDSKVDISTVLRKAKILAARLRNPEFQDWVDRELNGYAERADLPPYRIIPVPVEGHLIQGLTHWDRAPIMTSFLPERLSDWGEKAYLFQPISSIAVGAEDEHGDGFQVPWPQEMAVQYGAKGYSGHVRCLGAWQVINRATLKGVVDTVRNRILDFVLKIEAENPDAGEALQNSQAVPMERLQPIVHNVFYGPVGSFAQNSQHFNQTAIIRMQPDDLARLVTDLSKHLDELNLDARRKQRAEAQIATLKAELAGEPDGEPDSTIVRQAGRTLRSITEGAIGSLVATAAQPSVWQWIQRMLANF